ncbi:hypothetical protein [Terricaulis sp.]|uniref:hypothetical protein n=1 Tax=Terricaulis sp. TaxID=2768686 RepID=UPI00378363BA
MTPLPGRSCDGCTTCCSVPAIEAAGFSKPPSVACAHCTGSGCAIYDLRPAPCRAFECGWQVLPIIPEALKPDRSGVLVVADEAAPPGYASATAIKFIFITDASIASLPLLECIAGLVHARAAVFAAAPGPAGHHSLKTLLNPRIEHAVEQRDAAGIALTLASIVAKLRDGPFERAS